MNSVEELSLSLVYNPENTTIDTIFSTTLPSQITNISNDSNLIGKTISEVPWTKGILISNIERSGREIVPKGSTKLEANDRLTVIMYKESVEEFIKKFGE